MKYLIIVLVLWAGVAMAQDKRPESPLINHTKSTEVSVIDGPQKAVVNTPTQPPKTPTQQKELADKAPLIQHTQLNENGPDKAPKKTSSTNATPTVPYDRNAPTVLMQHTSSNEPDITSAKKKQ